MNIKSLLLGSAAALIAVSGARAADAVVVAEPEPAEYVKICDVYGAGYFYIPGTETCLRIGGYVRYDIGAGDVGSFDGARSRDILDARRRHINGTWYKNARFALKTWTGQETELGTLKTYTETRFNFGNVNGYGHVHRRRRLRHTRQPRRQQGRLAELRLDPARWPARRQGRIGLQYVHRLRRQRHPDTLVPYGGFDTNVIQYYFDAGNGFSAVVSLEEGSGSPVLSDLGIGSETLGNDTIDSYVPFVVGGVKYTQGWGAITGVVAYDSTYEEWAGKVRLDVNADAEPVAVHHGRLRHRRQRSHRNFYKQWGGNWAVWGGGTYTSQREDLVQRPGLV